MCTVIKNVQEARIGPEDTVISPEVLARIFEDGRLPFPTNPDGSVDMPVYLAWLAEAGHMALHAFDECFEVVIP
jgi:hypothetical protein